MRGGGGQLSRDVVWNTVTTHQEVQKKAKTDTRKAEVSVPSFALISLFFWTHSYCWFAKNRVKMSKLEKQLFNLKFAAKQLQSSSKKCDKEEKTEKVKVKKAIQKGNMEVARIHAENAIRQKNQSLNFLRMSARVDAVAARVQTAVTMNQVKFYGWSGEKHGFRSEIYESGKALMDKFEHQFETLDVQTAHMEDAMSSTTTLTTPQNQVEGLMHELADEAGLDLNMELPQGQTGSVGSSVASAEQDELSQRLAKLRDQM
ncbi:hypothetical protein F7725_007052 [Dissostichus mawsoni]|uniref:Charged multivesicular body protein 1b n=1 Tax=Dissostichus mawsoni TaxID=36200 RepID=A0A7J5XVN5_DISMA|nr:hypothetical protein F7725_007052 [Dissostichus mawsoni]